MEKAKQYLAVSDEASEAVSRLAVPPRRAGDNPSFYESFSLRGLRVDRVEPGLVVCSFKVPPRLADRNGNLAQGAIATMVDEIGYAVVHVEGIPISVSVNMSISYLCAAKVDDELEITSKVLGQKGGYSATIVLLRNKETGEIIAEGRHSLFNAHASKMFRDVKKGSDGGHHVYAEFFCSHRCMDLMTRHDLKVSPLERSEISM